MTNEEVQVVSALLALAYLKDGDEMTTERTEKVQNIIELIEPIACKAAEDSTFTDKLISILQDYANKEKNQPNNVSKLTLHVDLSDDTKQFFSKIEEYLEINKHIQKYEAEQKETP